MKRKPIASTRRLNRKQAPANPERSRVLCYEETVVGDRVAGGTQATIQDSFGLPVMEQRSETLLWHPWSHTRFRPPQNDNIGKEHFCLLSGSEDQDAFDERDGGGNRHWWSIPDAGREERHDALNRRPPGTVYPLPLKPADNRSGQLYARATELFTSALRMAEPRYTTTHGGWHQGLSKSGLRPHKPGKCPASTEPGRAP